MRRATLCPVARAGGCVLPAAPAPRASRRRSCSRSPTRRSPRSSRSASRRRMRMATPVGDFRIVLFGGGDAQPGGAFFMTMKAPDMPQFPETTAVIRGDKAWMKADGGWQRVAAACRDRRPGSSSSTPRALRQGRRASTRAPTVGGEPAVKITGVLDTAGLVRGRARPARRAPAARSPTSPRCSATRASSSTSREVSHLPLRMLGRPEHGGRGRDGRRCTSTSRSRT